jgi:hypothetical protein
MDCNLMLAMGHVKQEPPLFRRFGPGWSRALQDGRLAVANEHHELVGGCSPE